MREEERRYYNRKLLGAGVRNELKTIRMDWKDLIVTIIGVWLGLMLTDVIKLEELISNAVVRFVLEVLIVTTVLLLVTKVVHMIEKLIKNKNS